MAPDIGGDDDSAGDAGRSIQQHVRVLREIAGQLEQVAALLPAVSHGTRLGLLGDAELIARDGGDALHDLARTINDIRRKD